MKPRVAVIDVGSNSIKVLVARRGKGPFGIEVLFEKTLEVRISQGIGGSPPMMRPDRIAAGIGAVRQLWEDCREHGPLQALRIVATSAVRSSGNGHLFTEGVLAATGVAPQVLTGAEEADAIAMGVRTDPGVEDSLTDFTVFDLGGGSLEIIRFEHLGVTDRTSLPLGGVRLTERFITDPALPFPVEEQEQAIRHIRSHIQATGICVREPLVGCSGGLAALRQMFAAQYGESIDDRCLFIARSRLEAFAGQILAMSLAERRAIRGMPPGRADIFPTAMLVFRVLLELSGANGIHHSLHNLRYGLALRLLQGDAGS